MFWLPISNQYGTSLMLLLLSLFLTVEFLKLKFIFLNENVAVLNRENLSPSRTQRWSVNQFEFQDPEP